MSHAAPVADDRSPGSGSVSVLVTGAAGFIGSHLCERLLREGHRVWGLDNFDDFYDPGRKRKNVALALREPTMHLVEGDVRDEILLDGLMSDVAFDAVIHLAALPAVQASLENPGLCFDVNLRGTLRLLEAMRRHSVSVVLFGSSSSVYGEDSDAPFSEDAAADRPISPYAASKRSGELLCHTHHHLYGLTAYCLRLFSVYGPRQRPDTPVHRLARRMVRGEPLSLPGDVTSPTRRDYTYVDDVVNGIVLALESARKRDEGADPGYEVVNLGRSEAIGPGELVKALSEALEVTTAVEQVPDEPSGEAGEEGSTVCASEERGMELLGYAPEVEMAEGLAEFARWFREDGMRPEAAASTPPEEAAKPASAPL